MNDWIFAFFLFFVGVVFFLLFKKSKSQGGFSARDAQETFPLYVTQLMTAREQKLYRHLCAALPQHLIFAQVQASRVLRVKEGYNQLEWFNRINRLSFDYVVCDQNSYPLAVIELDDASHDSAKRMETDRKKDKAVHDAGLRMIRWRDTIPDRAAIARMFAA